ncbi:hypothetical protein [Paraburkholderia phenoliruptrix]|uniref:hypothetical protein n=1 Tax=Paraburkholderia phenoliruptrix TaxID=252970 RepID=UPI001C6E8FD5|nr:hypothetical protein [Paraburkholderia phenoliruptrix]MBW9105312.1 hypothetical protein [Paraburkholderia phenoliruptrix]
MQLRAAACTCAGVWLHVDSPTNRCDSDLGVAAEITAHAKSRRVMRGRAGVSVAQTGHIQDAAHFRLSRSTPDCKAAVIFMGMSPGGFPKTESGSPLFRIQLCSAKTHNKQTETATAPFAGAHSSRSAAVIVVELRD